GVVVWDMVCATIGRLCPKIVGGATPSRLTEIGPFRTPPACIYLFPSTIPTEVAPKSSAQEIGDVELLNAFHACFRGQEDEINYVDFDLSVRGSDMVRRTIVRRGGGIQRESKMTAIRRV
ncbi:MAG TPA: hypothetical protein VMU56_05420, partial [Beijerinckiaceae bacterium]|nr:hypothetical protein [Beijerinckiaceae bacterium]